MNPSARNAAVALVSLAFVAALALWILETRGPQSAPTPSSSHSPSAAPADQPDPTPLAPIAPTGRICSASTATANASSVLAGSVRARDDNSPIANAVVDILFIASGSHPEHQTVRTDDSGRYQFEWSQPVTVASVCVNATASTTAAERRLGIRVSSTTYQLDLHVTRGATLEGTVFDEFGRPLANARVLAWCTSRYNPQRVPDRIAEADANGVFAVDHLGEAFVLTAESPDRACVSALRGTLSAGARATGLSLVMQQAIRLRGRVLDLNSRPIADAMLAIREDASSTSDSATPWPGVFRFVPVALTTNSDGHGEFQFLPAPNRPYIVRVTHPRYPNADLPLAPTADCQSLTLEDGYSLQGVVRSWDQNAGDGALVRVRSGNAVRSATADRNGTFEVHGLASSNNAFVVVRLTGNSVYARQPIRIGADGDTFLSIQLEPPFPLAGRVVDDEGKPATDALVSIEGERLLDYDGTVFAEPTTVEWSAGTHETRTDALGAFVFPLSYSGLFTIRARSASALQTGSVRAPSGGPPITITIARPSLHDHVLFNGQVSDAIDESPVREFRVMVAPPSGARASSAHAVRHVYHEQGTFEIAEPELGPYRVTVWATGYAPWNQDFDAVHFGERPLDIALRRACSAELVILDQYGRSVRDGVQIHFLDEANNRLLVDHGDWCSDSVRAIGGSLLVTGLPTGMIRTKATAPGYAASLSTFTLLNSSSRQLVVELIREELRTCSLAVFVAASSHADTQDFEVIKQQCAQGQLRYPKTSVEISFFDDIGQSVAEARLLPTASGRFVSQCTREGVQHERLATEPLLAAVVPVHTAYAIVRSEGFVEKRVALGLHASPLAVTAVVLQAYGQ